MQLFVLVLNHTEYLDPILENMLKEGIGGGTILDSTGMMRELDTDENNDLPMFGLLRHMLNPDRKQSKTMFAVMKDEKIPQMMAIIDRVTGGLHRPDTGVAFAVPLSFVEGVEKKHE